MRHITRVIAVFYCDLLAWRNDAMVTRLSWALSDDLRCLGHVKLHPQHLTMRPAPRLGEGGGSYGTACLYIEHTHSLHAGFPIR